MWKCSQDIMKRRKRGVRKKLRKKKNGQEECGHGAWKSVIANLAWKRISTREGCAEISSKMVFYLLIFMRVTGWYQQSWLVRTGVTGQLLELDRHSKLGGVVVPHLYVLKEVVLVDGVRSPFWVSWPIISPGFQQCLCITSCSWLAWTLFKFCRCSDIGVEKK